MPIRNKKTTTLDQPWMTERIKAAIRKIQNIFNRWGETMTWRKYRNTVQMIIKEAKTNYYKTEIQDLKKKNPKEWWDFINKGLGQKKTSGGRIQVEGIEDDDVADVLNGFFAETWTSTTPLAIFPLPMSTRQVELCSIGQLKQALIRLSPHKACGPDGIPAWLLKSMQKI
ncbi:hypothetical protein J4Q44_G00051160 [Coregonus suidteri]|uniref:Uncharacterized protein n=1 Tax=Coregonus suidteri TaxID=861788 RepID=A0AAN8R715_9TELE